MLAAQSRLPAVYPFRTFVSGGGLMSYGADTIYVYRQAAHYVDRILKGEKPADLPVQVPTKLRIGHQPQDCQGSRPHRSAHATRARRRGDRMTMLFASVHLAAIGTWRQIPKPRIYGQY